MWHTRCPGFALHLHVVNSEKATSLTLQGPSSALTCGQLEQLEQLVQQKAQEHSGPECSGNMAKLRNHLH